ncbi:hypothetical protein [Actinophytocola sediminis]
MTSNSSTGGVAPPDGYTTDTDQMSSSGRNINNAAEDAQDEIEDLSQTDLTGEEFGTAHTEKHTDYAAAIQLLGEGANAMCANLMSFAGQLGGAGETYSSGETAATSTVTASGSDL